MANIIDSTQLVQLISGTQAKYDNLPDSSKLDTMLFFITDTHRIYKGKNLIANYTDSTIIDDLTNTIQTLQSQLTDVSTQLNEYKQRWVLTND